MQLNEVHNQHEHASVSLKVLLLIFVIVLVGALSYFVWDFNNNYVEEVEAPATNGNVTRTTGSLISASEEAGGFSFSLPVGYGAFFQQGCEGGCLYSFRIGSLASANGAAAVISEGDPIIVVTSRALEEGQTLENFNAAEELTDLVEMGTVTIGDIEATEYSKDGVYYVRFVHEGMGFSLEAFSDSNTAEQTKANEIVASILSTWSF